ncbi:hypothetical protein [Staphylococcus shinii]|uniref:hypothetical protein n=1 Tax=Staphylococcus shinii TaxID=2912228 RepID=UPI003F555F85
MDWVKWISIIISFIALIFSIWTFISNRNRNKFNVKFSVLKTYITYNKGSFIKVAVENNSVNPISITKFVIDNVSSNETPITKKIKPSYNNYLVTSDMPVHLNPYEAKNILVHFNVGETFLFNKNYQLVIYTTRGKNSINVDSKGNTENEQNLGLKEGELL